MDRAVSEGGGAIRGGSGGLQKLPRERGPSERTVSEGPAEPCCAWRVEPCTESAAQMCRSALRAALGSNSSSTLGLKGLIHPKTSGGELSGPGPVWGGVFDLRLASDLIRGSVFFSGGAEVESYVSASFRQK